MALNLVRNSKAFFTTNVDPTTGKIPNGGFGERNTFEIPILDGYSFSQTTNAETVTISESGATPVRGQNSFNTSLAPADFSFSTYIKTRNQTTKITADESVLWNALLTSTPIIQQTSILIGTGGTGSITSIAYTEATGVLSITGTNLPLSGTASSSKLVVGDRVVIRGLVPSGSGAIATSSEINGYGEVTAITTTTNFTVTLNTFRASAADTTLNPTGGAITVIKYNTNPTTGNVILFGTGGVGTVGTITYGFDTDTGVGTLTIPLTGVTSFSGEYKKGDVVVLSGIAAASISGAGIADTSQLSGGASKAEQLNQAYVVANDYLTGTAVTSIVLTAVNPVPGAVTIASTTNVTLTKSAWAENGNVFSMASTASSDVQQLQKFGLLFLVDNVLYALDNCALNQASIDFAIDGIATVAWSGQATGLRRLHANGVTVTSSVTNGAGTFSNNGTGEGVYGKYTAKDTNAECKYIINRLSMVDFESVNEVKTTNAAGVTTTVMAAGATYKKLPITGGNITINNNISYLTPALLGTVNQATTYYQGTRAISGSMTAYLKTGDTGDVGDLLTDLLDASATNTEVMMSMILNIGGASSPKIVIELPSAALTIPTVDVQQVVSTNINFVAEGSAPSSTTSSTFDLTKQNDLIVRYYA